MPINNAKIRRVLVRSPNWLGDMIMALPAIKALSEALKPEKLSVLTRTGFGSVFSRQPFVHDVVEFTRSGEPAAHSGLSKEGYDALFLFTNSFRSAWNGWKTGSRIRVGYSGNFRGWLLTDRLEKPSGLHMNDFYMEIAKSAGAAPSGGSAAFPLTVEEKNFAAALNIESGTVGTPLGARYGPAKRWPDESVKEFVDKVIENTDRAIILFGTSKEAEQADDLARAGVRVKNLAGKTTVGEMAAVMDRCEWIVANDSGPLHVAAALGKKSVAIFGPTDPALTAPLAGCVTIVREKQDCAPCHQRVCLTDHACMKAITADMILRVIQNG
ncbi:MAG: lipopolysaccharide heptosyltransferase II [Nitrospinota bacterium]